MLSTRSRCCTTCRSTTCGSTCSTSTAFVGVETSTDEIHDDQCDHNVPELTPSSSHTFIQQETIEILNLCLARNTFIYANCIIITLSLINCMIPPCSWGGWSFWVFYEFYDPAAPCCDDCYCCYLALFIDPLKIDLRETMKSKHEWEYYYSMQAGIVWMGVGAKK